MGNRLTRVKCVGRVRWRNQPGILLHWYPGGLSILLRLWMALRTFIFSSHYHPMLLYRMTRSAVSKQNNNDKKRHKWQSFLIINFTSSFSTYKKVFVFFISFTKQLTSCASFFFFVFCFFFLFFFACHTRALAWFWGKFQKWVAFHESGSASFLLQKMV